MYQYLYAHLSVTLQILMVRALRPGLEKPSKVHGSKLMETSYESIPPREIFLNTVEARGIYERFTILLTEVAQSCCSSLPSPLPKYDLRYASPTPNVVIMQELGHGNISHARHDKVWLWGSLSFSCLYPTPYLKTSGMYERVDQD